MRYPIFKDAEYSITNIPVHSKKKRYFKIVLKTTLFVIVFLGIAFITNLIFTLIMPEGAERTYVNSISIGSAMVTIFSAIISVLSLVDSGCMKKYDDDLHILESRYLNGNKISGWEFLDRCSYKSQKSFCHNYYIVSAEYTLYSGLEPSQHLTIIVPALSADFRDLNCLAQICRIRKFLPFYLKYIYSEQEKYKSNNKNRGGTIEPSYFIPLPYNIIALYKKILMHKILNYAIGVCIICVITSIVVMVLWISSSNF